MQTTVNLADSLYVKSEFAGATVEQIFVDAVKKEVQGNLSSGASGIDVDRELRFSNFRRKISRYAALPSWAFCVLANKHAMKKK